MKGLIIAVLGIVLLSACGALVERAGNQLGENLRGAILDHDDPATVAEAMPAWLLLLDAMLRSQPESSGLLISASRLYSAYTGLFVDDQERAERLSQRSLDYARRALCLEQEALCQQLDAPFLDLEAAIGQLQPQAADSVYALATAWTGWIQVNRNDYAAIADLPKVEALLRWVIEVDEELDAGGPFLYLAVLNSQRPAAVGGDLEGARGFYERALALSADQNLLIKVYYAEEYSRMVFDQDLHDRLLREVLAADPDVPGYALGNHLAQARAEILLEESNEYF
ncbi:MAG: hypothetical protein Tsb002_00250 [Wenzhouxiangellaceae bacterium]